MQRWPMKTWSLKTWSLKTWIVAAALLAGSALPAQALADTAPDPLTAPIATSHAAQWTRPQTPLRIWGQSYYVGTGGLSVMLIRARGGLILIDSGLPQTVAMVEDHIRQLGFRLSDVRYILVTEPHFDHAGGAAAIARDSGALVVASPRTAQALRRGQVGSDDPQSGDIAGFPAVARVREIKDGEAVKLGKVAVVAHYTPGHTAGSTTWTWTDEQDGRRLNLVFAASLNPVSADGYRFSDTRLPDTFRRSAERVAALPCDILVSAHPDNSGADRKLAALEAGAASNPFIDPGACRVYAARAGERLQDRLADERRRR